MEFIREALKMGYSCIDTAAAYCNERAVGRAIKASGIAREDIFLSTKLWPCDYENENAVNETLERLGTEYVDGRDIIGTNQRKPSKIKGLQMI